MRICCRFTVRKQEILLNYVGTPVNKTSFVDLKFKRANVHND